MYYLFSSSTRFLFYYGICMDNELDNILNDIDFCNSDYTIRPCENLYFPRTERWIIQSFNIDYEKAVLYQMILNKGYITWTKDWIAHILGWSVSKVKRVLELLLNKGIIIKKTVYTGENTMRQRTIYVALYTVNGRRADEEIARLLSEGMNKIRLEYAGSKAYKRK